MSILTNTETKEKAEEKTMSKKILSIVLLIATLFVCGSAYAVTTGEKNALSAANNYLSFTAFSKTGLFDQLKFEGYTDSEAKYAVENCGADWKEQAVKAAQSYLSFMAFSNSGLIDQLKYDGYTEEEAKYGVENINADQGDQAVQKVKEYLRYTAFSHRGLVDQCNCSVTPLYPTLGA